MFESEEEGDFHTEKPFPRKLENCFNEALHPSDKESGSSESSDNEKHSKGEQQQV